MSTQANLPSDPPGTSSLAGAPRGTLEQDAAATCSDLLRFIDESPTPFHAAASAAARLVAAGFRELHAEASWRDLAPGGYYLLSGDGTLVAFVLPELRRDSSGLRGFRIVGAHTDSPNLRLKPRAVYEKHGYVQLGVEVYGSPLLNSWLDRDLQLAGRVIVREADGRMVRRLVRLVRPLVRVAQLAIHLDREVNEKGLLLNRQEHLPPLLGLADGKAGPERMIELCAQALSIDPGSIVNTELMLHDSQPSTRAGLNDELIFAPRLDNLGSSHAALSALLRAAKNLDDETGVVPLVALFDHEEIGSSTAYGAGSPLLPNILERIVLSLADKGGEAGGPGDREAYHRALAGSVVVSADMAHAVHPNYPDRHEVNHRPVLNGGPVIKVNANQRYATCGRTSALFTELCRRAKVPVQNYSHRTDLACGSTIGPITSTLLAVPTVDVGSPMLSMHSARELAGAEDPELMARVLSRFLLFPDTI
jgi:aspartyl aminopeptidase